MIEPREENICPAMRLTLPVEVESGGEELGDRLGDADADRLVTTDGARCR
jgi:hypothetical protein